MKRRNRLIRAYISAIIVSVCCTAVPVRMPAVNAADTPDTGQLPGWLPDSYGKALDFVNTYGGTHLEDGLLCVVFCKNEVRAPDKASPEYTITVSGDAMQEVFHELYLMPSEGPFYVRNLEVILYQPVSSGEFKVSLSSKDSEVLYDSDKDPYIPDYQFVVDDDLVITETDPYSWAPDCITEFEDFRARYGAFSANGNLIAACLNPSLTVTDTYEEAISSEAVRKIGMWGCSEWLPAETGQSGPGWHTKTQVVLYEAVSDGTADISWQIKGNNGMATENPNQSGGRSQLITGKFLIMDDTQTVLKTDDAKITLLQDQTDEPVTMNAKSGFALYQIVNSSDAKPLLARLDSNPAIVRELGKRINGEQPSLDTASFALAVPAGYEIAENGGTITKLENGSYDICFRLKCDPTGDINRDAVLSRADADALVQWLTANQELQNADWKAADLNQDGMLNAVDLALLKRKLMNPAKPEETDIVTASTQMPVIADSYGDITDNMKEQLREAVLKTYPGSDLSDFKLVYAPDHPLTKQAGGACFYVYYQNTLVHGLGDLDLPNNVYAAVREDGKAVVQLLASPESFLSLDLTGEDASEALMQNRYKGDAVDRIIYVSRNDRTKPVQVAYRVIRSDVPMEEIYAENGVRLISIQLPSAGSAGIH